MSRTTRRRTLIASTALTAGLVLAAPLAANAHVGVSPDELTAGGFGVLTFSFAHGCENSPTTALRIAMPDGLTSAAPTMDSDWEIDIERGEDGLVSAVTYTATSPVPSELRGAVSMSIGLDEDAPASLAFPVEQRCVAGTNEWTEIAENGEDPHSLDAPAPVVNVAAAVDGGHDTAHSAEQGGGEAAVPEATPTPLATFLGAGGLVAGIAALIVSVLAYRRRA